MWDQAREFLRELVFHNRDRHAIPVLDGPLKPNKEIDGFQVVCDSLRNPDDIAIDAEGALYVSTENCVVKLSGKNHLKQEVYIEFEDGLPGGLNFHPDGRLMVCVGGKGLVLINDEGHQTWIEMADGTPISVPFNISGGGTITLVPEPSTALLLASGLVAMAAGRRRRAL